MKKHLYQRLLAALVTIRAPIFIGLVFLVSASISALAEGAREDLAKLYPHLSPQTLNKKIKAAENSFMFFRSFVPYYYSVVKNNSSDLKLLEKSTHNSGWCVGDAHIENFGALLIKNGHAIFSVNDLDDAGPCPLTVDALRFFTSVILYDKDAHLEDAISAYISGLTGTFDDDSYYKVVRKLLKKAEEKGAVPDPNNINKSQTKLIRDENSIEVPAALRKNVETLLKTTYGSKTNLRDIYEKNRNYGGSGGLLRIETLVVLPNKKITIIELKQVVTPGIFPLATQAIPEAQKRFEKTLNLEQTKNHSPLYQIGRLNNMDVLLRPRWDGNIGIKISKYDNDELWKIILEEAYALGNIHRQSADSAEKYIKDLLDIKPKHWINAAEFIAEKIKKSFKELQ